MPSPEEKQRRKDIRNKLIAQRKAQQLAELPMPKEKLSAFFDYLDQQLTEDGCDHNLRFTKQFADDQSLPFDPIKQWLADYGGYCDCEALANVEDHFENL